MSTLIPSQANAKKASDISDVAFIRAVIEVGRGRPSNWADRWGVGEDLGIGEKPKLVLAKARSLIRRGLIDGCTDGCRGDFTATDSGRALLGS